MNLGLDYQLGDDINALRETVEIYKAFCRCRNRPTCCRVLTAPTNSQWTCGKKWASLDSAVSPYPKPTAGRGHGLCGAHGRHGRNQPRIRLSGAKLWRAPNPCINQIKRNGTEAQNKKICKTHQR